MTLYFFELVAIGLKNIHSISVTSANVVKVEKTVIELIHSVRLSLKFEKLQKICAHEVG